MPKFTNENTVEILAMLRNLETESKRYSDAQPDGRMRFIVRALTNACDFAMDPNPACMLRELEKAHMWLVD